MTDPQVGDRNFRNTVVRIADLTLTTQVVEGYTFSNCRIIGPAVIVFRDSHIANCTWEGPGRDALFWEIPPSRRQVVGAVLCERCQFSGCIFEGIGIAGPPEVRAVLEAGISQD